MSRRTAIYVDQSGIEHNLEKARNLTSGCNITAMVKANAYGCGYEKVLPVLDKQVWAFGVACLNEAIVIRQLGYKTPCILFQGTFSSQDYPLIDEYEFSIAIHSELQLQQFLSYPFKNKINCWVKIDTGMHRLGFAMSDISNVIQRLSACKHLKKPIGIMSHYACADTPDHPMNRIQQSQFESIRNMLGLDFLYSMSNSAAIIHQMADNYDVVRPGIMLYGGSPLKGKLASDLDLKPVSFFSSQIISIKSINAGDIVGYGAQWQAKRKSIIAVVAAGYGDGYPRHIREEAFVSVNNQFAPIVGRISMDMMTIDITDLEGVSIGDDVELWGSRVPIDSVASWAGSISYELLCQHQRRVEPE